jgi:hypothetical protein
VAARRSTLPESVELALEQGQIESSTIGAVLARNDVVEAVRKLAKGRSWGKVKCVWR